MSAVQITVERSPEGEYRHRCFTTEDGRQRRLVGCSHLTPRSAIAHSDSLSDPTPSPDDELHSESGAGELSRRQGGAPLSRVARRQSTESEKRTRRDVSGARAFEVAGSNPAPGKSGAPLPAIRSPEFDVGGAQARVAVKRAARVAAISAIRHSDELDEAFRVSIEGATAGPVAPLSGAGSVGSLDEAAEASPE